MKVYILYVYDGHGLGVEGVFATRELAQKHLDTEFEEQKSRYTIEAYNLAISVRSKTLSTHIEHLQDLLKIVNEDDPAYDIHKTSLERYQEILSDPLRGLKPFKEWRGDNISRIENEQNDYSIDEVEVITEVR